MRNLWVLTRTELLRHGPCGEGLALWDELCALQRSEKRRAAGRLVIEWTPLAEVWAATVPMVAGYLAWARERGIGPGSANLSGANLSGANLTRAYLTRANLSGANLSGAYLTRADLSGADLSGAYLTRANLSGANLSGANLTRAYLGGANLTRAYLSGAYLTRAYLGGANLGGAYLGGANLSGAAADAYTRLPAGYEVRGGRVEVRS